MPLDPNFIQALLEKELEKATGVKQSTTGQHPRPVQLGPLRWFESTERCASRNCGGPTRIKIRGIRYCMSHALTVLNRIILTELEHIDLSVCSCNAGVHSKGNIHTDDCAMYAHVKQAGDVTVVDMDNLL